MLESVALGLAVSLAVFGALLVIAPNFTRESADLVREKPGKSFLIGCGGMVVLAIAFFLLVPSTAVFPLFVVAIALPSIGLLAVGRAVSERWLVAVPVAATLSVAGGMLPYRGNVAFALILGSLGLGAAYQVYADDGETEDETKSRFSTENMSRR